MCKNISSEELLDELANRVEKEEIKVDSKYLYDIERYETKFWTDYNGVVFFRDWDVKTSARYRINYETYCLPLINQQAEKELAKNMEEYKKTAKIN